jgi:hypothetical protein
MSLMEPKKRILELLWQEDRGMKPVEITQKLGFRAASVTMHLLGLNRSGQVMAVHHGQYVITDMGKEAIGLPKIDRAQAMMIMAQLPSDKSFHFYNDLDQYLGVQANSLADFCEKIQEVSDKSIEFHISRRDFESWFNGLGDAELARRMGVIRSMNLTGNKLRSIIQETVKRRQSQLKSLQ